MNQYAVIICCLFFLCMGAGLMFLIFCFMGKIIIISGCNLDEAIEEVKKAIGFSHE